MKKIIFIDDEKEILNNYVRIFETSKESSSELRELADGFFELEEYRPAKSNPLQDFTCFTASQGEEGIEIIRKELQTETPIQIAFIDMRMPPGIDGKECAKRIRALDPNIEIVIVTAYSDSNLEEVSCELDAQDKLLFLKKPFDIQEIRQLALNLTTKYNNERIKDDFISNVSHELKTPLATILGFYQLLDDETNLSSEQKEYIGLIGKSAKLMQGLINELICSVEFKKQGVEIEKNQVNLGHYIKRIYRSLGVLFENNPEVEFLIDSNNLPTQNYSFDELKITQCINNIVGNAAKFTTKGSVKLSCTRLGKWLEFTIVDTGPGIPREQLDFIFGKFNRVENKHHQTPGLGLGLSVVKSIMDAHNGKVLVESEEGVGSRFSILIPINSQE